MRRLLDTTSRRRLVYQSPALSPKPSLALCYNLATRIHPHFYYIILEGL